MNLNRPATQSVYILVKAYPQPSQSYEETVCCAGITEDGKQLLRLYPIRYRRLNKVHQFKRFDLVEMAVYKSEDSRPESYKVVEDSCRVLARDPLSPDAKVKLWTPFIVPSLETLQNEQQINGRSLGIIRPDQGSVQFKIRKAQDASKDDQEVTQIQYKQMSLLEDPLISLPPPEYAFSYRYTSNGKQHEGQIHDWEVQAAYVNYRKRYGHDDALNKLRYEYENNIPNRNLHFIMGTVKARPWQFLIIGLLRSSFDPVELAKQGCLF